MMIINSTWETYQPIRMVSHDASEIKDWSNGCWKFNFDKKEMHLFWKYFQIENIIL